MHVVHATAVLLAGSTFPSAGIMHNDYLVVILMLAPVAHSNVAIDEILGST